MLTPDEWRELRDILEEAEDNYRGMVWEFGAPHDEEHEEAYLRIRPWIERAEKEAGADGKESQEQDGQA